MLLQSFDPTTGQMVDVGSDAWRRAQNDRLNRIYGYPETPTNFDVDDASPSYFMLQNILANPNFGKDGDFTNNGLKVFEGGFGDEVIAGGKTFADIKQANLIAKKKAAGKLSGKFLNALKLAKYTFPIASLAAGGATAALGTVGGSSATNISQIPGLLWEGAKAYGKALPDAISASHQAPSSAMLAGSRSGDLYSKAAYAGQPITGGAQAIPGAAITDPGFLSAAGQLGTSGISGAGLVSGATNLVPGTAAVAGGAGMAGTGLTSGASALSATGAAVGAGGAGMGWLSTATNFLKKAAPITSAAANLGLAGATIYGAVAGSSAAKKAANAQVQGIESSNQLLRDIYEQNRADLAPWRETGERALGRLDDMYTNGDYSSFETSPGYNFLQEEGQKAQERGAASRGMLLSGRHLKELERFAQGTASQEFGNYWNREAGLAGVGQTAVAQGVQAGQNYGKAAGSNLAEAGTSRASGYVGSSNAISDSITQALYARAFS